MESLDPIEQVSALYDQMRSRGLLAPVCLSTIGPRAVPNSRFVDLKGVSEGRLYFGTDERSAKAREFGATPEVSLCAWWETIPGQIRVIGRVERASASVSDRVFASRNPTAQAVASVSVQSTELADYGGLQTRVAELVSRSNGGIPRPPTWWVYAVVPHEIEILRFSDDRVYQRTHFRLVNDGWTSRELSP